MYEVKDISKIYSQGEQEITALSCVNLKFHNSGFVAIVGESGSGKTTLLNILAGFDKSSNGELYFEGNKLEIDGANDLTSYYREDVGFVFQEYNVIDELTIWENVELPLNIVEIDIDEKKQLIETVLTKVGLFDLKDKKVSQLSGGQKQRVAIARAYVKLPKVILADEPTGNLDYDNSIRIFEMLAELSKSVLVIMVTHNKQLAVNYADRIISLSDGSVISDKELSKEDVVLKLSDGQVEEYVEDYSQIIDFVKNHVGDSSKFELIVETKSDTKDSNSKTEVKPERFKEKKLGFKNMNKISTKILAKRKIRQLISIGIFTITIFLSLLGFDLILYNEDTAVKSYLEDNGEEEILLVQKIEGLYGFTEEEYISVSHNMKYTLSAMCQDKIFFQRDGVVFSKYGNLTSVDDINNQENTDVISELRIFNKSVLTERFSLSELKSNEIIITDSLAKAVNITKKSIGKEFYLEEDKVILKAIVTGEENVVYVSDEFVICSKKKDNKISVNGNFLDNKSLFEYVQNMISISSIETMDDAEISKLITDNSQVVLSSSIVGDNQDIIGKTFYITDIYQDKYKDAFNDCMNLYEYLGAKVTVVGIADFDGDVCVSAEVFNKIKDDYYSVFAYDQMGIYQTKWNRIISEIHNNDMRVEDKNLTSVYEIVDSKPVLLKYIALILALMIVLTIFIMISIIGYSIEDNSKIIGILKSLGISNSEIKKIFMIQPIRIIVISFLLAFVALVVVIKCINVEYMKQNPGVMLDIIHINVWAVIISLMLSLLIGIITVILPLKEMDKKTIVETLRF